MKLFSSPSFKFLDPFQSIDPFYLAQKAPRILNRDQYRYTHTCVWVAFPEYLMGCCPSFIKPETSTWKIHGILSEWNAVGRVAQYSFCCWLQFRSQPSNQRVTTFLYSTSSPHSFSLRYSSSGPFSFIRFSCGGPPNRIPQSSEHLARPFPPRKFSPRVLMPILTPHFHIIAEC